MHGEEHIMVTREPKMDRGSAQMDGINVVKDYINDIAHRVQSVPDKEPQEP